MEVEKLEAIYKDIAEIAKKHGVIIISGEASGLNKATKHLEGLNLFITSGEKKLYLRGGESLQHDSSITLKLTKNRYNGNK
jgi:hypothetical protein